MNRTQSWKATTVSILLATILTVGLMVAWLLVVATGAMVYSILMRDLVYAPSLVFTIEGQPLLQTYDPGSIYAGNLTMYRTLDGRKIEDPKSVHVSEGTMVPVPPEQPQSFLLDGWTWRILGFGQSRPAPVNWYLIHDEPRTAQAYFVGYQPQSKRLIGYLGRRGFRHDVPPADERFSVPLALSFNGGFVPRFGSLGVEPQYRMDEAGIFYMVSDRSLVKIDFARQSVQPVAMPDKVVAVGAYQELTAVPDERLATYKDRMIVRLPKELRVLSMEGDPLRTIPLTEPMRGDTISLVGTTGDETILIADGKDLYRIGPKGDVTSHEQVTEYERPADDKQAMAWGMTGFVPMPAVLVAISFRAAAEHPAGGAEPPDFATAYAEFVSYFWAPFLVLLIVSAALAYVCYRRGRRLAPEGALAWAIFVLLLGPPGFIGYWVHRRWPAKARCEHCGATVPRDRGTCLACAAAFPPPPLTGVEVFA